VTNFERTSRRIRVERKWVRRLLLHPVRVQRAVGRSAQGSHQPPLHRTDEAPAAGGHGLRQVSIFIDFFGQRHLVPLLLLGPPFFPMIHFGSTTLLTWMTGISLHMQWPLTFQSHGSFSQREQLFFCYGSNSTPKPGVNYFYAHFDKKMAKLCTVFHLKLCNSMKIDNIFAENWSKSPKICGEHNIDPRSPRTVSNGSASTNGSLHDDLLSPPEAKRIKTETEAASPKRGDDDHDDVAARCRFCQLFYESIFIA
jgi:hypothetical protein